VPSILLHVPETISSIDSTISEDSSYYLHTQFLTMFPSYVSYTTLNYSLDEILDLINTFAVFHSKIDIFESSKQQISSRVPLELFRYKLLDDGTWYYVKTVPSKHKEGKIVEGALWSNGMYYVVRTQGTVSDAGLYVNEYTKEFYGYP